MATEIFTSFGQQLNASGSPVPGAKIYVYDAGTTDLRSVYSNAGLSVSAANPIICDAAGRHDMRYTAAGSYKVLVTTSAGATVYTRDNIDGRVPVGSGALAIANGGTGGATAEEALTNLGGATSAEVADVAAEVASLSGTLASVEKTHIATGTTAQRPTSPIEGDIRRNTTTGHYEGYDDSSTWQAFITTENIAAQVLVAANLPAGAMVGSTTSTYTSNSDLTTAFPNDNSIPQSGEGTQIISVNYTPASTTNKLRVRFSAFGTTTPSGLPMGAALFQDSTAGALCASTSFASATDAVAPLYFEHEYVPATISQITLKVRVGPPSGTMRLNGTTGGRLMGGVGAARLVIEEIKA